VTAKEERIMRGLLAAALPDRERLSSTEYSKIIRDAQHILEPDTATADLFETLLAKAVRG
jgi:hypothetical protein